jgi:hypothetical protein
MAIPPTFWSQQNPLNQTPPTPGGSVTQPTPGDGQPIPYLFLPGSELVDPAEVAAGRDQVFPLLTGDGTDPLRRVGLERLAPFQLPPGFNLPPSQVTPDQFRSWHSALQVEYMRNNFGGTSPLGALSGQIGAAPAAGQVDTRLGVVVMPALADASRKILILNDLDKRDYAKLTLAEQTVIAGNADFRDRFAATFGLIPAAQVGSPNPPPFNELKWPSNVSENVDLSTPAGAARAIKRLITSLQVEITTHPTFSPFFTINNTTGAVEDGPGTAPNERLMRKEDMKVFLDQLDNLKRRAEGNAIFSPNDVATALAEIQTRWKRAAAFANVNEPSRTASATVGSGNAQKTITYLDGFITNESDGGIGTIRQAFQVFMAAERQILDLDNRRAAVAAGGRLGQRNLDAPTLIAQFQFSYNGKLEARLNADAQEINQFNVLLKLYTAFQAQINKVSGSFDTSKNDQVRGINTGEGNDAMNGSAQEPLVATFRDGTFGGGPQAHPLETIYNISRPLFNLVDANYNQVTQRKNAWDQNNATVSDKVTLINQQSQINSNNINSLDRQKNRHFDVANSALSKLSDMLQSIGRNLA